MSDMYESVMALLEYAPEADTLTAFHKNRMLKDAVERRLTIIGEAFYQANKMDKDLAITDKKKIMGLRHILVHDYDKLKPETLYTILKKNIAALEVELKRILDKFPPQGSLELDD